MEKIRNYIKHLNLFVILVLSLIFTAIPTLIIALYTFNFFNRDKINYDILYIVLPILSALLFSIIICCTIYLFKELKIKKINFFDDFMVSISLSSLITIVQCILFLTHFYNVFYLSFLIVYVFALTLSIVLILFHMKKTSSLMKSRVLFTLKNLLYDDPSLRKSLLIDDEPSFPLTTNTKNLFDSFVLLLNNYSGPKPFIININGAWGSGKTTFWNNIKDKLDERFLVSDTFDIWKYSNEETMFAALYKEIIKTSGIVAPSVNINKAISIFVSYFLKADQKNIESLLNSQDKELVSNLSDQINDYLRSNNKCIVFAIDNIGRADADNIKLLFKALSLFIDVDNIVYVLLYDENIVNQVLKSSGYPSNYLDKIIDFKLNMPDLNNDINAEEILNALKRQIEFCLNKLQLDVNTNFSEYKVAIMHEIPFKSNREVVRFLNQIPMLLNMQKIFNFDFNELLALYTIKVVDNDLFIYLKNNNYFLDRNETGYLFNGDALKSEISNIKAKFSEFGEFYKCRFLVEILCSKARFYLDEHLFIKKSYDDDFIHFGLRDYQLLFYNFDTNKLITSKNIANDLIIEVSKSKYDNFFSFINVNGYNRIIFDQFIKNLNMLTKINGEALVNELFKNLKKFINIRSCIDDDLFDYMNLIFTISNHFNYISWISKKITNKRYIYAYSLLLENAYLLNHSMDPKIKSLLDRVREFIKSVATGYKHKINKSDYVGNQRIYKYFYATRNYYSIESLDSDEKTIKNILYIVRDFIHVTKLNNGYSYELHTDDLDSCFQIFYLLKDKSLPNYDLTEDGKIALELLMEAKSKHSNVTKTCKIFYSFDELYCNKHGD